MEGRRGEGHAGIASQKCRRDAGGPSTLQGRRRTTHLT